MNFLNKPIHFINRWLAAAFQSGTTDQVLARDSTLDLEVKWVDPSIFSGVTDADAIHDNVASEISAITAKGTPIAGDFLVIEDSAAANVKKSITMADIDHDALTNFLANEHIDWTAASQDFDTTGSGDFDDTLTVSVTANTFGLNAVRGAGSGLTPPAQPEGRQGVFESDVDAGISILAGSGGSERASVTFGAPTTQADASRIVYSGLSNLLTVGSRIAGGQTSLVGGTGSLGVRVDASGNVGIKNSSPSSDLDVTGNIAVSGTVDGVDLANVLQNIVEDTTPQLGGHLDVNGQVIGDGTRELLTFVEDGSAVNHLEIENQATGSGPIFRATGDDTDIDLNLEAPGTGSIIADSEIKISTGTANANLSFTNASQEWIIRGNDATGELRFIDQTNNKAPLKFTANTNADLLRLGITAVDQVDITGNLDVTGNLTNASIAASLIDSGTLADARISESSVRQHTSTVVAFYAADSTQTVSSTSLVDLANFGSDYESGPSINTTTGVVTLELGFRYLIEVAVNYEQTAGNNRDSTLIEIQDNIDSAGYALSTGGRAMGYSRNTSDGRGSLCARALIDTTGASTDAFMKVLMSTRTASRTVGIDANESSITITEI